MDNKDQRNASVPLGTFNEDGASDASENTDLFVQVADQDAPAEPTSSADFARARPGRKRVRTLLGVPLADMRESAGSAPRSGSISEAIQHMLDEQAAVALEVDERESDPGAVLSEADLDELAEIPRSGVLSVGPNPDESVDDSPTKTRIPLLVPSQYVEAGELDRAQVQSAGSEIELEPVEDDERPTRERVDEEALTGRLAAAAVAVGVAKDGASSAHLTAADGGNAPMTPTTKTSTAADGGEDPEPATATPHTATAAASRSPTAPARSAGPAGGRAPAQQPVSSLAPREVARRPPAARDAGPGVGLLMVAVMALIAAGGWWLTSGSFSRSRDEANARGAATQAAASQPIAPPAESAMALGTEAPPGQTQAAQASNALAAQQSDSQSADQGSAAPNPLKASKSLTATSRSFRPKSSKAPKLLPTKEGGLPEAPTRADVLQRMESVRPAVRACATGLSGVADLDVTIAHSGRVTHVLVGGDFAGTTQGSCIARAVREAKFPSFKQERFRLLFPYPI